MTFSNLMGISNNSEATTGSSKKIQNYPDGFFVRKANSCKEYALVELKNHKYRQAMEDTYCHKDKANNQ